MNKSTRTTVLNYAYVYAHWVSGFQTYSKYVSTRNQRVCGFYVAKQLYFGFLYLNEMFADILFVFVYKSL